MSEKHVEGNEIKKKSKWLKCDRKKDPVENCNKPLISSSSFSCDVIVCEHKRLLGMIQGSDGHKMIYIF